ncbi:MAG: poly-gamma-glutamate hydrolase family protein, partial [Desulfobacterales bacterium]
MARDTYSCFAELDNHEERNKDYKISAIEVGSGITIIAPHGGKIEPGTSDIARRIASQRFNYYCFEG